MEGWIFIDNLKMKSKIDDCYGFPDHQKYWKVVDRSMVRTCQLYP